MTRLEQALRWWYNNDDCPIPERHFKQLEKANFFKKKPEWDGYTNWMDLNKKGKSALRKFISKREYQIITGGK